MGLSKHVFLLRMALGGFTVGFLVGSAAGAVMGLSIRWNLGLDGSLLGGVTLSGVGTCYGLLAGWLDTREKSAKPTAPALTELTFEALPEQETSTAGKPFAPAYFVDLIGAGSASRSE